MAGIRGDSGYRYRMRRQESAVAPSASSTSPPLPTLDNSTTSTTAVGQTADTSMASSRSANTSTALDALAVLSAAAATMNFTPTGLEGPPANQTNAVTSDSNPASGLVTTYNSSGIDQSDATPSSPQPSGSPPAQPAVNGTSTGVNGATASPPANGSPYQGQVSLTKDMAISVTANESTFAMMLDTAHACSWYVATEDFKCYANANGLASKMSDTCHTEDEYQSGSKWPCLSEVTLPLDCQYELGNTTISGFAAYALMNITGNKATQVYPLRAAHSMSSSLYGLDNFIHRSAGVLSVLPQPDGCGQNQTIDLWKPTDGEGNVVYMAPRRSADGVFSRGDYPLNDMNTINSTSITAQLKAPVVNSGAYERTSCSWGIPVTGIRVGGAAARGGDDCIVDTMSRFNEFDWTTAAAIADRFNPPGWYNAEVGRFQVDCNASLPIEVVSVVLADRDFPINPSDLRLKNVPPYYGEEHCYSAFRATNYTANAACRLGWPFLRNVGLGFDVDTLEWNVTSRPLYAQS